MVKNGHTAEMTPITLSLSDPCMDGYGKIRCPVTTSLTSGFNEASEPGRPGDSDVRPIHSWRSSVRAHVAAMTRSDWIDVVGRVGLLLFSFGVLYRTLLVHEGFLLMGLALVFRWRPTGASVTRDPLIALSLAFLLFVVIRTLWAVTEFHAYRLLIVDGAVQSIQIAFFTVFIVAFWMHRARRRWDWLVLALMTGFIVRVLRKLDWLDFPETVQLLWSGVQRAAFGSTANRFGVWNAVILAACLLLYRRIWGDAEAKTVHRIRKLFWMVMTVASAAGLVFSQSRSAWAATILILAPALIWKWHRSSSLRFQPRRLIIVLLAAAAGLALFSNIIERRLLTGGEAYLQILSGDIDIRTQTGDDNVDSLYERLLIYRLFWEKWRARPWIGYGPGTSEILIASSSGEYGRIARYNHFHNLGFDILIQLGAVGLLFYGILGWLIIKALWQGHRSGSIPFDYFLFVLSASALVLASCLTGQAMRDYKGVYLVGFLGGMAYTSRFANTNPPLAGP